MWKKHWEKKKRRKIDEVFKRAYSEYLLQNMIYIIVLCIAKGHMSPFYVKKKKEKKKGNNWYKSNLGNVGTWVTD